MPPSRTASLIKTCSFSQTTLLQNTFRRLTTQTVTGFPTKDKTERMMLGSFHTAVSKGLGLCLGTIRFKLFSLLNNSLLRGFFGFAGALLIRLFRWLLRRTVEQPGS